MHMYPTYVASNKITLYTDAWLYGVQRSCAKTALVVSRGISHAAATYGGYSKRAV